jgi:hypothetical protein
MTAATPSTFVGARLLEPIERHQHIQFIERRIAGERLMEPQVRPHHFQGEEAKQYAAENPVPQNPDKSSVPLHLVIDSYNESQPIDISLRPWAKSQQTYQNHLCEYRYNRHIFSLNKIPPASQTAAIWQMGIPPVPDVFPLKTLLERIQREKRLIREQRENRWLLAQVVGGYEADWRTQAERDDLLRTTKKARRSPHGLPPRSIVKDIDGHVPLNVVPTLKTGNLPQPPDELLSVWNNILLEQSKNDKTPLAEEIDFYPPSFGENRFDGRDRSSHDERVGGSEFDGINYDGTRETTRDVPNDTPRRSEYQEKYKHVIPYNPLRKGRTEEAEQAVRNHRDFLVDAFRHHVQTTNTPVVEIAKQMGVGYDWLRQQLSRGNQTLDLYKTNAHVAVAREIVGVRKAPIPFGFNISVCLNNTVEIKHLGALTDSPETYLKALARYQEATIKDALKYAGRRARTHGWTVEQLEAEKQVVRDRIKAAYRPHFESFQREAEGVGGTLSQFPHKVEGRST